MENNVEINRFVFPLICFGIFTFICSGVNSSEFNIDGEYLFSQIVYQKDLFSLYCDKGIYCDALAYSLCGNDPLHPLALNIYRSLFN